MKVVFLDFDGVLNSTQSNNFWKSRRTQDQWEEGLRKWDGSMQEYIAEEFCPICVNNLEELFRRVPNLKIVISSSWRINNDIESLKRILSPAKLASNAIIDITPRFLDLSTRGLEIKHWLDNYEEEEITHYVIIDDANVMLDEQKKNFVHTSELHGFQYGDMLWALRILGEGNQC